MAKQYKLFPFTPEIMESFRTNSEIPVNFYNKEGQVLLYKKDDASPDQINALFNFMDQGIYYDEDDSQRLGLSKKQEEKQSIGGLTDTKLLSEQHGKELANEAQAIFSELKNTTVSAIQANKASEQMTKLFDDFESQPDAMSGLINIIELMQFDESEYEIDLAVKRTVVAMSLKTRGMHMNLSFKDRSNMRKEVSNLMVSAMLCDIGYFRMNMPLDIALSIDQMNYMRNHPIMSYLMIAHEESLDRKVKHNMLCHHRPKHDAKGSNNYPSLKALQKRLIDIATKYSKDPKKIHIARDVKEQLKMLAERHEFYDENANILSISSEFASLTSEVPWRAAFPAKRAVQMILNNSYFTYTPRIVNEFLDYVSISLCNNEMIINNGDYVIVVTHTSKGKTFFEVCVIEHITRFQSKPRVYRIGTIQPIIDQHPKYRILEFDIRSFEKDPRRAHYDLASDDSRNIIYHINPLEQKQLFRALEEVKSQKRSFDIRKSKYFTKNDEQ